MGHVSHKQTTEIGRCVVRQKRALKDNKVSITDRTLRLRQSLVALLSAIEGRWSFDELKLGRGDAKNGRPNLQLPQTQALHLGEGEMISSMF